MNFAKAMGTFPSAKSRATTGITERGSDGVIRRICSRTRPSIDIGLHQALKG